jgi:hypothetical protein
MTWTGNIGVRSLRGGLLTTDAEVAVEGNDAVLAMHQLAFPGWQAFIDGQAAPLDVTPWLGLQSIQPGFLLLPVPPGRHNVHVQFGSTLPRTLGGATTLLAAATMGAWAFWCALRHRRSLTSGLALGATGLVGAVLFANACGTATPTNASAPLKRQEVLRGTSLLEDVLSGRAAVRSSSGAELGPDRFVDVRYLSVLPQDRPLRDGGARTKRWLFMHPPAEVSFEVTVPAGAILQTSLAMDPAMWQAPLGEGVRYRVTIADAGGPRDVLSTVVNPRAYGEQRRWIDVLLDLSEWSGKHVQLTLRTDPRDDPFNNWAGWGEPTITVVDPLTAARMARSAEGISQRTFKS